MVIVTAAYQADDDVDDGDERRRVYEQRHDQETRPTTDVDSDCVSAGLAAAHISMVAAVS